MEPSEVETFKAILLGRRRELEVEGDLDIVPEGAGDDTARKPDDDAKPLAEMNQVIASSRNRARAAELAKIAAALVRLSEDPEDFGICDGCEDPIPHRRLELMPWATSCIRCQEAREDDRGSKKRRHLTDYD